jgi:hypothetical protein
MNYVFGFCWRVHCSEPRDFNGARDGRLPLGFLANLIFDHCAPDSAGPVELLPVYPLRRAAGMPRLMARRADRLEGPAAGVSVQLRRMA